MDKDLYIEFLENRIRAGGNQPAWDPVLLRTQIRNVNEKYQRAEMDLQNRDDEIQDLKLENDRLSKRNDKMWYALRAIACVPDCEFCMLRGSTCDEIAMKDLAVRTLTELEEL